MTNFEFEPIERVAVPAMDEMIGRVFPVASDGFIRLIDYFGGEDAIVQAARVSYQKGTKKKREDRGLLRYLIGNRHTSPLEMAELKIHVRVPMDTWRQWIRHRTANVNEYSTRYSIAIDSMKTTEVKNWRKQSKRNKQGSGEFFDVATGRRLSLTESTLHQAIRSNYAERIHAGVAREQARKDLPLSTYTEAYWKIDVHNLIHFLGLRMDIHAQKEIREYATIIGEEILAKWMPNVWQAFLDYRLNAVTFSGPEWEILREVLGGLSGKDVLRLSEVLDGTDFSKVLSKREQRKFQARLLTLLNM